VAVPERFPNENHGDAAVADVMTHSEEGFDAILPQTGWAAPVKELPALPANPTVSRIAQRSPFGVTPLDIARSANLAGFPKTTRQ
jgi:hypothetical protein